MEESKLDKQPTLNIAWIGLGQGGGNVAEAAARITGNGLVAAVNSSGEDLRTLVSIADEHKYKMASITGSAKNRTTALNALSDAYQHVVACIKDQFSRSVPDDNTTKQADKIDIMFIVAAGGGGTGSGSLPAFSVIMRTVFTNTLIVPVLIMPSIRERGIAQKNALDCLNDIVNAKVPGPEGLEPANFSIVLVDNTRVQANTIREKYKTINEEIVRNIHRLAVCTKTSDLGNIDIADRMSMFSVPGLILVGSSEINKDDNSPIMSAIMRAIKSTPVSVDYTKSVNRILLQCEAEDSLYTEDNIADAKGVFPKSLGDFEGFYGPEVVPPLEGNSEKIVNRVLVAFAGGQYPEKLIQERRSLIEDMSVENLKGANIPESNAELKTAWGIPANSAKSDGAKVIEIPKEGLDSAASIFGQFGSKN